MKRSIEALFLIPVVLAGCGPDEVISDLQSPNGSYHVEVRKCPQKGAPLERSEMTQVSVLEAGKSERCNSAVNALVQFDSYAEDGQLQLEWISNTELRAWHPHFNADYGPFRKAVRDDSLVSVRFTPKL